MFQAKRKLLLGLIGTFSILLFLTPVCFAGVDAAPFLRLGAGARSLGVGGAFTAVADDATSTVWNPAGLPTIWTPSVKDWAFTVFTTRQAFDSKHNFIGIVKKLNEKSSFGFSWINVGVDDIIGFDNTGVATGERFDYSSNAIALSYGHAFQDFNLGATVRLLTDNFDLEGIDGETGFGGFDLGVLGTAYYKTVNGQKTPGVKYGATLRNLGGSVADGDVPVLLNLGVSYKLFRKNTATFSFDIEREFVDLPESTTGVRLGVEYLIAKTFAIRGGSRATRDRKSLFAGFGVNVGGLQLDYALKAGDSTVYDLDQGSTHFVSLSYSY